MNLLCHFEFYFLLICIWIEWKLEIKIFHSKFCENCTAKMQVHISLIWQTLNAYIRLPLWWVIPAHCGIDIRDMDPVTIIISAHQNIAVPFSLKPHWQCWWHHPSLSAWLYHRRHPHNHTLPFRYLASHEIVLSSWQEQRNHVNMMISWDDGPLREAEQQRNVKEHPPINGFYYRWRDSLRGNIECRQGIWAIVSLFIFV